MSIVTQKEISINYAFHGYNEELQKLEFGNEISEKLIRMIRAADSEEKAMVHLEKYAKRKYYARFTLYSRSSMIQAIQESRKNLDYFGLGYPEPPELIKELLENSIEA